MSTSTQPLELTHPLESAQSLEEAYSLQPTHIQFLDQDHSRQEPTEQQFSVKINQVTGTNSATGIKTTINRAVTEINSVVIQC